MGIDTAIGVQHGCHSIEGVVGVGRHLALAIDLGQHVARLVVAVARDPIGRRFN